MATKWIQQIAQYTMTCCEFVTSHCANRNPQNSLTPNRCRISFNKFLGELLRLAHAPAREPERFFLIQAALAQFGDGIAQVCFQFAPVVGREVRLRGQFLPPAFNGSPQIETGLIFHNLLKVL